MFARYFALIGGSLGAVCCGADAEGAVAAEVGARLRCMSQYVAKATTSAAGTPTNINRRRKLKGAKIGSGAGGPQPSAEDSMSGRGDVLRMEPDEADRMCEEDREDAPPAAVSRAIRSMDKRARAGATTESATASSSILANRLVLSFSKQRRIAFTRGGGRPGRATAGLGGF